MELLLTRGVPVNHIVQTSDGTTTHLHLAAQGGNAEVIGLLLKAGAKVDARDSSRQSTPLMIAASTGHLGAVQALISGGGRQR